MDYGKPAPAVLLGLNETADYLGVTERTIRRYVESGRLRAFRLGPRMYRFRVSDIESLLEPVVPGEPV